LRKAWLQAKTVFLSIQMAHIIEAASDTTPLMDSAPSLIDPTEPLTLETGGTINLMVRDYKLTPMKASTKVRSITAKSKVLESSHSQTAKSIRAHS
jgi:hypothetical protein